MNYFSIEKTSSAGPSRTGVLNTKHGQVATPVFMPVGTYATVKSLGSEDLLQMGEAGAQILLCNAYHLYLRPGDQFLNDFGGLHRFMNWPRAILTDSGGFQLHSLAQFCAISEAGATFRSHIDGTKHFLTPEKVLEIQHNLGVDIAMPLDSFCANPASYEETQEAMELTKRWLERTVAIRKDFRPHLHGIIQGGTFKELRRLSAKYTADLDVDGFSIGGLSVGEDKPLMWESIAEVIPLLPHDKPRYLMGVGTPEDLVEAVNLGVDMFDCVLPTRNARNGMLFTSCGSVIIKNAQYAKDEGPIDPSCACFVCQKYSRAYIRYLFKNGELLGLRLNTFHNVFYYLQLMRDMRRAIEADGFTQWREAFYSQRSEAK